MKLVERIIRKKEVETKESYVANGKFLLYGSKGKSSLVAALSTHGVQGNVIELTPAGASVQLEDEYENFISHPVANLAELKEVITGLARYLKIVKTLTRLTKQPDSPSRKAELNKIKKAIETNGYDFDYIKELAQKEELPFKAVCIAECNIVSSWIEEEVRAKFDEEYMGQDKKGNRGFDWNVLKSELTKFYQTVLSLPLTVILATAESLPSEKQNINSIVPNICVGSAQRAIIDMIGNVFYTAYEGENYVVYMNTDNRKMFTKQKIQKIRTSHLIDEHIVVTGDPSKLWSYIDDYKNEKVEK